MIFQFEITEQDIVDLGNKFKRPVTLDQAAKALATIKPTWDETVEVKRLGILSGALDVARGIK